MQAAVARSETDEPHLPELSFINSAKKTDEDLKKFVLKRRKKNAPGIGPMTISKDGRHFLHLLVIWRWSLCSSNQEMRN